MEIDWSKAPEGATHHCSARNAWLKQDENDMWLAWQAYGRMLDKPLIGWCFCHAPSGENITSRVWTGEGLPPVGTVCAMQDGVGAWTKVEIFASHFGYAHGWDDNKRISYFSNFPHEFRPIRPIRTPEQIAAEERDFEIIEIERVAMSGGSVKTMAEALYDAGYRKVPSA